MKLNPVAPRTVGELIAQLQRFPADSPVWIADEDDGFVAGIASVEPEDLDDDEVVVYITVSIQE